MPLPSTPTHSVRATLSIIHRFIRATSAVGLAILPISSTLPASAAPLRSTAPTSPLVYAPATASHLPPANACFTEYTSDNTTDFSSTDASAVQQAVDAVPEGGTVKVAGTCAGVQSLGGNIQTVFISKTLTMGGGYTNTDWMTSDPIANPTVLDAQTNGRVILATRAVTVSNLTVHNGKNSGGGGGAYFQRGAAVSRVNFFSNTALYGGGARFDGVTVLSDTVFSDNTSVDEGGGAYFTNQFTTLTNTIFISNSSGDKGGGAYAYDAATLNGGLFQNNQSMSDVGGGLYAGGTLVLTGTQFLSNTASANGGGLFAQSPAQIASATFNSNTASNGGGAAFASDAKLIGTSFESNTVTTNGKGGGAVFSGTTTLTGTTFTGNSAENAGGGAVFGSTAVLTGTTFTSNTAANNGGGAWFGSTAFVNDGVFQQNTAGDNMRGGGAFFNGTATVSGTQFISNTFTSLGAGATCGTNAACGGGAYFFSTATVTVSDFISNSARNAGGTYFFSTATLTDSTFVSNPAALYGGGALFVGTATLTGTTFTGNSAQYDGGGAMFGSTAVLTGTSFISNTAQFGGGAWFDSTATLTGATFTGNTAQYDGGGARFISTAMLTGTTFTGNTAQSGGGMVVYQSPTPSRIVNSLFARNTATSTTGSALFLLDPTGSGGTVEVIHTTVSSPTLAAGSAIAVGKGNVVLTNTLITSHTVGIDQTGSSVVNEDFTLFSGVATPYVGGITSGGNSITGTAGFVDPANDNYRILNTSTALNTGTDAGVNTDFDGNPRPQGAGFDIGAFEFNGESNVVPPSGLVITVTAGSGWLRPATSFTYTVEEGSEPITFTWDFGDGSPVYTGTDPVHLYPPGTYTLTVIATNSAGSTTATLRIFVPYRLLLSIMVKDSKLPLLLQQ